MTEHAVWLVWHLCVLFLVLFIVAAMPVDPPSALTVNVGILLVVSVAGFVVRVRKP